MTVPTSTLGSVADLSALGSATDATAMGALVPDLVLTTQDLRRQQVELARIRMETGLVSAADAVLESSSGPALLLLFVGGWTHVCNTLLILSKQAFYPDTPLTACVIAHVPVYALQCVNLTIVVVLGNYNLTHSLIGTTNAAVQPKRLILLSVAALTEALLVLPLVAPTLAADVPPLASKVCHIDFLLPPDAERHEVVGALLTKLVFLQAAFVIGVSVSIFALLLLGLAARRPLLFIAPTILLLVMVAIVYLFYYVYLARRIENMIVFFISLTDSCVSNGIAAVGDMLRGTSNGGKVQGLYGANVHWSLEPIECLPSTDRTFLAVVSMLSTTTLVIFAL